MNPLVSLFGRLVARSGRKRGNRQTDALNRARISPKFEHWNTRMRTNWNIGRRSVRIYAMPKAGPSPLEWKRRLEAFARGEYAFSTGQKPRKGSR